MKNQTVSIIEQFKDYLYFHTIHLPVGIIIVNTSRVNEFIDRIYIALPDDIKRQKEQDGKCRNIEHIVEILSSIEREVEGSCFFLGYSFAKLDYLNKKLEDIQNSML